MAANYEISKLIGGSPKFHARVTGLFGAVVLASGTLAGSVASRLIEPDDMIATSSNIVASESLFRLGIVGSLVMMLAWLFYALLLFRLLRPVGKAASMTMVVLVLASVPIYMLNQVNLFAALLSASSDLQEHVALFMGMHRLGNLIAAIFFGLWLLPLGFLVFKSSYLPRWIGMLLIIGSPGYLILFVQGFLFPGSERTLWTNPFLLVTHLSELALLVWLLIMGIDTKRWEEKIQTSDRIGAIRR